MISNQKIKQSIYSTSRQISREVSGELGMDIDSDAVDLIAELTMKKLTLYCSDLEAFQKHAKRSTITTDDVKLLVRRNDSLKELLDSKQQTFQSYKSTEGSSSSTKRKRGKSSTTDG